MIPDDYIPSVSEVEKYLSLWNELDNYVNQENALDKLFFLLCRNNTDLSDILIKCSTLNDFYSTNIYDVHSVAKHIFSISMIDKRLQSGDLSLVEDIANVKVGKTQVSKYFFSFASKYCSHHQPMKYAIFDKYVEKVLLFFRGRDRFCEFKNVDLKRYHIFISVIKNFQEFYGLEQYNLKQIDRYLWQLGKAYM